MTGRTEGWAIPMGPQVGKPDGGRIHEQVAEYLDQTGRSHAAHQLRQEHNRLGAFITAARHWQQARTDAFTILDELAADYQLNQAISRLDQDGRA